jgi:hypothetical protein
MIFSQTLNVLMFDLFCAIIKSPPSPCPTRPQGPGGVGGAMILEQNQIKHGNSKVNLKCNEVKLTSREM